MGATDGSRQTAGAANLAGSTDDSILKNMRYILLLRGINVGGKNKVSMNDLKASLEDLGYQHVVTYINSGNVIFDTDGDLLARTETLDPIVSTKAIKLRKIAITT